MQHEVHTGHVASAVSNPEERPVEKVKPKKQVKKPKPAGKPQVAATPPVATNVQAVAKQTLTELGQGENWSIVHEIFRRESTWNPAVTNSIGCIGLGQACPDGIKADLVALCPNWATDVACQVKRFNTYALGRYGSWPQALAAWNAQGWW